MKNRADGLMPSVQIMQRKKEGIEHKLRIEVKERLVVADLTSRCLDAYIPTLSTQSSVAVQSVSFDGGLRA